MEVMERCKDALSGERCKDALSPRPRGSSWKGARMPFLGKGCKDAFSPPPRRQMKGVKLERCKDALSGERCKDALSPF